jgi:glyoxylase-like metal-dependent hydrolase (beta-lactamase superfamily II)
MPRWPPDLPDPPDIPQARVDHDLDDGDVLDDGLQVISTPGHTAGSIAVLIPERGVLFTGDVAAEREGAVFLGQFNTDRARAKESFRRLAAPEVTTVCFGHGAPLQGERAGLLRAAASSTEIPDPLG